MRLVYLANVPRVAALSLLLMGTKEEKKREFPDSYSVSCMKELVPVSYNLHDRYWECSSVFSSNAARDITLI